MSFDCALIFYRGEPLSLAEVARRLGSVVQGKLGEDSIAVRHVGSALTARALFGKGAPTHALAFYYRPAGRQTLKVPLAALAEAERKIIESDAALGPVIQPAFTLAREALKKARPDGRSLEPAKLGSEFFERVAAEVGRVAGSALFATQRDELQTGAYALFQQATRKEAAGGVESYGEPVDRALTRYADVKEASVHGVFWEQLEPPKHRPPMFLVIDRGQVVSDVRMLSDLEEDGFERML